MIPLGGFVPLASLRCVVLAVIGCAAITFAGCAPLPPMGSAATPANTLPAPVPATRPAPPSSQSAPAHTMPVGAAIDSTPTAEALAVLASIPEPLGAAERVPPPASGVTAPPDSGGVEVPVPEPTLPLGERHRAMMDSAASNAPRDPVLPVERAGGGSQAPPGSTTPQPAASPPAHAGAAPDTCWRIQVLAPLSASEAEQARATALSQLLVPMVVELEAGRYKVRTRDCLTRTAADLLRRRAIESGFRQAFRVTGGKR